jgi:hypothetical protein
VQFGLVALLKRRPPMTVVRLAEAVGMGKGQISRPLGPGWDPASWFPGRSALGDSREVLVCPTHIGPVAHDAMVAEALERNQRLLEQLGKEEAGYVDRLTDAAPTCSMPKKTSADTNSAPSNSGAGRPEGVKIACLAPLVALR